MSSRQLMATIAGAATMFLLGYILYGLLLMGYFEANSATGIGREMPVWWALIAGQVVYAAFLVHLFGRGPAVTGFGAGARFGGVIGVFVALSYNLAMFATMNVMNLNATLVDVLVYGVMSAAAGGVIAIVQGRGSAATP